VNPLTLAGGAGGITGGAATSGDSKGEFGTGNKNISFAGGNPNTIGGVFSNPVVLMAIVAGLYLIMK